MLANLNDVLIPAKQGHYAIGLFNAVNMEMGRGIIEAAEKLNSPVIMGTAEVLLPYGPLDELSWYLIPLAKKSKVPVVIHYDHGLTYEKCIEALKLGFTSIMYDCSTDNYEVNVRKVAELTYIAHQFGATVEGELGHVGDNVGSAEATGSDHLNPLDIAQYYTDPEQAYDYVTRTKIDALAIAVGTAHGAYKFKPRLDFDRIQKIANIISTPLVLHGGSGLSTEDFQKAIDSGISKINIFTDINQAGAMADQKALKAGVTCKTDMIPLETQAVCKATIEKMKIFLNDR